MCVSVTFNVIFTLQLVLPDASEHDCDDALWPELYECVCCMRLMPVDIKSSFMCSACAFCEDNANIEAEKYVFVFVLFLLEYKL